MNQDVRFAALRAASKLALQMTLLAGCASRDAEDPAAASTEEEDLKANKKKPASCHSGATDASAPVEAAAPVSCDALLASTFSDPKWKGWTTFGHDPDDTSPMPKASADVKTCCEDALEVGVGGGHRWACCNVLAGGDASEPGHRMPIACTPWGPPVPPAMRRRAELAA